MTDVTTAGAMAGFRFDPFSPQNDADPFPAYKILRDEYPLSLIHI